MATTKERARKPVSKARRRELDALWNKSAPADPPIEQDPATVTVYEVLLGDVVKFRVLSLQSAHNYCNAFNACNFWDEPRHHSTIRERQAVLCSLKIGGDA